MCPAPDDRLDDLRGGLLGGRYQLGELLGKGGMGEVYRARDGDREVAVKLLSTTAATSDDQRARFEREARAYASARSPHVVRLLDHGEDAASGRPYIVMELLEGRTLGEQLASSGPLRPAVAAAIFEQVLRGLDSVHETGLVHRDIKPSNLFLAQQPDGSYRVVILDMGIARWAPDARPADDTTLTSNDVVLGSTPYMSPEQIELTHVDRDTDHWSVAASLYEALGGRRLWHGATRERAWGKLVRGERPAPLRDHAPWVARDLALATESCFVRDIDLRRQAVARLRAALRLASQGAHLDDEGFRPLRSSERTPLSEATLPSDASTTVSHRAPRRLLVAAALLAPLAFIGITRRAGPSAPDLRPTSAEWPIQPDTPSTTSRNEQTRAGAAPLTSNSAPTPTASPPEPSVPSGFFSASALPSAPPSTFPPLPPPRSTPPRQAPSNPTPPSRSSPGPTSTAPPTPPSARAVPQLTKLETWQD